MNETYNIFWKTNNNMYLTKKDVENLVEYMKKVGKENPHFENYFPEDHSKYKHAILITNGENFNCGIWLNSEMGISKKNMLELALDPRYIRCSSTISRLGILKLASINCFKKSHKNLILKVLKEMNKICNNKLKISYKIENTKYN